MESAGVAQRLELQFSKLVTRVRLPSPAQTEISLQRDFFYGLEIDTNPWFTFHAYILTSDIICRISVKVQLCELSRVILMLFTYVKN